MKKKELKKGEKYDWYNTKWISAIDRDDAVCKFYKTHNINHYTILNIYEDMDQQGGYKVDLSKKITISLSEDDIKEIVAEYANGFTGLGKITKDNVELMYGIRVVGPSSDSTNQAYLRECIIKS